MLRRFKQLRPYATLLESNNAVRQDDFIHEQVFGHLALEPLRGDRCGQYSIRINAQWRICFYWNEQHAEHVAIIDYH